MSKPLPTCRPGRRSCAGQTGPPAPALRIAAPPGARMRHAARRVADAPSGRAQLRVRLLQTPRRLLLHGRLPDCWVWDEPVNAFAPARPSSRGHCPCAPRRRCPWPMTPEVAARERAMVDMTRCRRAWPPQAGPTLREGQFRTLLLVRMTLRIVSSRRPAGVRAAQALSRRVSTDLDRRRPRDGGHIYLPSSEGFHAHAL